MNQEEYDLQIKEAAHTWCMALHECAGAKAGEDALFWERLMKSPGVFSEYVYYMVNQNFACKYMIQGISIVDILVWQVDYFKAGMDMGRKERENPDRLLLSAFTTMLDMEDNPEKIIEALKTDTGTDYPGKY